MITVLMAPSDYMDRPGSSNFDQRVTYEEMAAILRSEHDGRALFLADAMLAGIAQYRAGYVMRPDEMVTGMWRFCWETASRVAPLLNLGWSGDKPGRSVWIYFREAAGFEGVQGTVIVYKADRGQVDLQFTRTSVPDLARRCAGILDRVMKVVPANKSASVRVQVPIIDFHSPPAPQEANLMQGLAACERLRILFLEHRSALLNPGA